MPPKYKPNILDGVLYTLHFQKVPSPLAHQKLLEITGEEAMSLEQVTHFYKKIDNGSFDLREKVKTLEEVIGVMKEQILKYVDVKTRLTLRRTCRSIRATVDTCSQNIQKLKYFYGDDFIELFVDDFSVRYEFIKGGILVRHEENLKLVRVTDDEEKLEMMRMELMTILGNEKLRIATWRIEEKDPELQTLGMRVLRHILDQLPPQKLKVTRLEYILLDLSEDFTKTLESLDSAYLESLFLSHDPNHRDCVNFDDAIYDLEQWKQLKTLEMDHHLSDMRELTRSWTHFERARVNFEICVDSETRMWESVHDEVMELKEVLLKHPALNQYQILFKNMRPADFNKLNETLGTNGPAWTTFKDPGSDKNVLKMLVTEKMIWFKGPCYAEEEEVEMAKKNLDSENDSEDEDDDEDDT
ncbi:hypothetical protein CRE_22937 [Caenorhabditis remanei]|uniref:DUF38 domain-containing protein n=1 Tax=Caenorhabditis remanei TaxID=31234 RepID=E3MW68_CAERE|nr:hypothetical protein CRE_22937 [Caenorhabditis remanei]